MVSNRLIDGNLREVLVDDARDVVNVDQRPLLCVVPHVVRLEVAGDDYIVELQEERVVF